MNHKILAGFMALSLLSAAPAAMAQTAPDYAAIVAAPDRSAADRQLDTNRAPAAWLAYLGVKPGMKVLDVFAVNGYKAELMARAGAKVYAQNSEGAMARIGDKLAARLKTPAGATIVSVVRPIDDPAPAGMHDFDLATFFFAYHDITYLGIDRPKMLKAIYAALKPGGYFIMATGQPSPAPASAWSRRCTARTRSWSPAKSRRPDLSWSGTAISCAIPRTSATRTRTAPASSMAMC
ncbi:MAG TPA: methyltransferase domain-containing protein [Stellaceae bacterium]